MSQQYFYRVYQHYYMFEEMLLEDISALLQLVEVSILEKCEIGKLKIQSDKKVATWPINKGLQQLYKPKPY